MNKTPGIALSLLLVLLVFTPGKSTRRSGAYKIRTVVIDAGHGGHDTGCLGSSAREKNVALAIALRLGKLIEENNPDVKVIYTRKTDVFIPLYERAAIANRNHADLFICIHLNSGTKTAYGVETYVMGLHKSEDNLLVAKRENSSILLEDDYKQQYDGFDPNSPEANIIFSLYQNQFMHQSLLFASKVEDQVEDYGGRFRRGVKQAGFLVLFKTAMPAVLIECGFLTHEQEEKFLDSDKGQHTMATCVYRAFKEYKIDMESPGDHPSDKDSSTEPPSDKPVAHEPEKVTTKEPVKEPIKANPDPVKNEVRTDSEIVKPVAVIPVKNLPPATKPKPELTTPPAIKPTAENSVTSKPYLAVQVGATMSPARDGARFENTPAVKAIKCTDGYTRYVTGNFNDYQSAQKKLQQMKNAGFKDAFITGLIGNQRLSLKEAQEMMKRE